jgi:hypothetical protein
LRGNWREIAAHVKLKWHIRRISQETLKLKLSAFLCRRSKGEVAITTGQASAKFGRAARTHQLAAVAGLKQVG